jgi:hypothetical protein
MSKFDKLAVGRLKRTGLEALTSEQLAAALDRLSNARKNRILTAVRRGQKQLVGRLVLIAVDEYLTDNAEGALASITQNGVISDAELVTIFGE